MSAEVRWSEEQLQIIRHRRGNLLVSAAAGAGKTAVLVERILQMITEENGVDLNDLLICTFTRLAANQMKERIMKRLVELLEKDPGNARLQLLLTQIPSCRISTIHAFCLSVVKRFIAKIPGLDPAFRSGDENESTLLAMDVLTDTIAEAYDKSEQQPASRYAVCFDALQQRFGGNFQDGKLEKMLFRLYRFIRTFPDPLQWLQNAAQAYSGQAGYDALCGAQMLLEAFDANLRAEKQRRSLVDFSDYEHYALQILTDPEGNPSEEAKSIAGETRYIFIDEYQDSNELQERILQSIAHRNEKGHPDNIFMVGDIKQSIYRFRGATPGIFEEKLHTYTDLGTSDEARIFLQKNYRSRPEVLDGINYFFESLMYTETCGYEYTDGQQLCPGRRTLPCPENVQPFVPEVHLLMWSDSETYASKEEYEAEWTACQIEKMLSNPAAYAVSEKKDTGFRPLQARDIVILLRSAVNKDTAFVQALERHRIPCVSSSSVSFFQSPEIQLTLELLRCIDNVRQDIPLSSVLHSPLGGCSAEDLAVIRLSQDRSVPFYEAVFQMAQEQQETRLGHRLKAFLERLTHWREMSRMVSMVELLETVYHESGLKDYTATLSDGERAKANLDQLLSIAQTFEEGTYSGLFQFLRFIDRMQEKDQDYDEAQIPEEENAVRIMTIHKSKGLEFPVVFLPNMHKSIRSRDAGEDPLLHEKAGIGMMDMDPDYPLKSENPTHTYVEEQIRRDAQKEEMRILYVAMTRAAERLILSGVMKPDYLKQFLETSMEPEDGTQRALDAAEALFDETAMLPDETEDDQPEKLSPDQVFGADSFLKWMLDIYALKGTDRVRFIAEAENAAEPSEPAEETKGQEELPETPSNEGLDPSREEEMDALLLWQYPHQARNRLPMIVSVSALKASHEEERPEDELDWSEILKPLEEAQTEEAAEGFQGAHGGTLFHEVLERADFEVIGEEAGRRETIRRLVDQQIFTAEEADVFPYAWLEAFTRTDLYRRMKASRRFLREESFLSGFTAGELQEMVPDFFKDYAYMNAAEEMILVQGIIDAVFLEEDGWVVVDYKTDRFLGRKKLEMYSIQVNLYAQAMERSTGIPVKEKWIYDVRNGRPIRCS